MKVSFYCKNCELDYDTDRVGMSTAYGGIKKFISHCPECKREQFRLAENNQNDPYYYQSKNVIINRQKFGKDLLQPNDYGFRTFYKQEYDKIQKAKEEFIMKEQKEKKERDIYLKEHSQNIVEKNLARKILLNEEEIKYGGN